MQNAATYPPAQEPPSYPGQPQQMPPYPSQPQTVSSSDANAPPTQDPSGYPSAPPPGYLPPATAPGTGLPPPAM